VSGDKEIRKKEEEGRMRGTGGGRGRAVLETRIPGVRFSYLACLVVLGYDTYGNRTLCSHRV